MRIVDDFVRERAALRATLVEVGPDASTACGDWTTTDLAVHVATGEVNGGWATAPFRMLVARGVRIDRMARLNTGAVKIYRRRGFDWALRRLERPPPRAHLLRRVVPVSLLEVWSHHEDVLLANGLQCTSGIDVQPIIDVLTRYQRKPIAAHGLTITGTPIERARVLAGRAEVDGVRLSV